MKRCWRPCGVGTGAELLCRGEAPKYFNKSRSETGGRFRRDWKRTTSRKWMRLSGEEHPVRSRGRSGFERTHSPRGRAGPGMVEVPERDEPRKKLSALIPRAFPISLKIYVEIKRLRLRAAGISWKYVSRVFPGRDERFHPSWEELIPNSAEMQF